MHGAGDVHRFDAMESMVQEISPSRLRPLRRIEYERLLEAGAFAGERIELLFGMLVTRAPAGPAAEAVIAQLHKLLSIAVGSRGQVLSRTRLALSDDSEPEPDVMIVPRGDPGRQPPALFVVEVAEGTIRHDRRVKGTLYAAAGIGEYWIVNPAEQAVEVYSNPEGKVYRATGRYLRDSTICPRSFPDTALPVREFILHGGGPG